MAPLDFEILSKLMRYVFTFLGVLIVWRTFSWLRRDRKETHRLLRDLPDAGFIGLLTVLEGSSELQPGAEIPVPAEGVLGFVRTCDVVVPVNAVVSQHLDFTFRNGKGLYIYPRRGCPTTVDGHELRSRGSCRRHPMRHGSILCVGEAVLQLGVFAGLNVKTADASAPAVYADSKLTPPSNAPAPSSSVPTPAWDPRTWSSLPNDPPDPWQTPTPPQRRPGDGA